MAEKRTSPERSAATGRRKHPATIDLTATELPPAPATADVPPAAPAPPPSEPPPTQASMHQPQEPATAPPEPDAPPAAASPPDRTRAPSPALIGGAAGAGVVLLVLLVIWALDVLPVRTVTVADNSAQVAALERQIRDLQSRPAPMLDSKTIDALGQRIGRIESSLAALPPGDADVADKLAAADSALKSLGVALAAINKRGDDIAANTANANARADAAEKAVTDLRASLSDVAKSAAAGVPAGDVDALQKRIAALEQSAKEARSEIAKTAAADTAARLALSASALRTAVFTGAPFSAELHQVKSLGASAQALTPLDAFAATGVPSAGVLANELHAVIPAMLKLSGAQAPPGGFLEKLEANASRLVRIRPVDAPPGDDTAAVLARIEIAAAKADIVAALIDLGKLNDATRAPAQAWIEKAKARQAALAATRALVVDTSRALGKP